MADPAETAAEIPSPEMTVLAAAITLLVAMATISAMDSHLSETAADVRKRLRFRETTAAVETTTRVTAAYPTATPPTGRITRKFPAETTVIPASNEPKSEEP